MSELDALLNRFREHEGVEHLVLLARDGLVVRHLGSTSGDVESVAARVPALALAGEAVGRASRQGHFMTAVLEFEQGVAVVVALPGELLLTALVGKDVGFGPLLRDLRRDGSRLSQHL